MSGVELKEKAKDNAVRIQAYIRVAMRRWVRENLKDIDPRYMDQVALEKVLEDKKVDIAGLIEKARSEIVGIIQAEASL